MKKSLILALCAAAVLAACGGGHDDDTPPPATSEVPASASASVDGLLGYLKRLVAAAADTLEPVDVSAVTPPADDAAEPAVVD
jgi:ABC-type glycerol-3-phosphate transport system substrate-binding protein